MSKHLLSFMIGEMERIRIICKTPDCGTVTEIPLDALANSNPLACPKCNTAFRQSNGRCPLQMLGQAIMTLKSEGQRAKADYEFNIPVKETNHQH